MRICAIRPWLAALMLSMLLACATKTPEVLVPEYRLDSGPVATQTKSDIGITVKPIRISDMYDYPQLFSFRLESFPEFKDDKLLKRAYPVGPQDLQWDYPFATEEEQLTVYWVTIANSTEHILRMKDARVYLITEGREPVAALTDFDELLEWADYFERKYGLPDGFYRALIMDHKPNYKLINDLGREILPSFTYEGLLAFPIMPMNSSTATLSFFDVTVATDAAGNPIEKTRFDFPLTRRTVRLWYDKEDRMWKSGVPTTTTSP